MKTSSLLLAVLLVLLPGLVSAQEYFMQGLDQLYEKPAPKPVEKGAFEFIKPYQPEPEVKSYRPTMPPSSPDGYYFSPYFEEDEKSAHEKWPPLPKTTFNF